MSSVQPSSVEDPAEDGPVCGHVMKGRRPVRYLMQLPFTSFIFHDVRAHQRGASLNDTFFSDVCVGHVTRARQQRSSRIYKTAYDNAA